MPVGTAGNSLIRINLLDTNTKLALFHHYNKGDTATSHNKSGKLFQVFTGKQCCNKSVGNRKLYKKRPVRFTVLKVSKYSC
jgi:hypothetical protein